MMNKFFVVLFFSIFISIFSQGPQSIATADRNLWKLPMQSTKDFDVASKLEMLVFAEVLADIENIKSADLNILIDVKNPNLTAVEKWKKQTKSRIQENIKFLDKNALSDVVKIPENASYSSIVFASKSLDSQIPALLKPWHINSKKFYRTYILECIRLASKSPKRTSEIDVIDASEKNGFEFEDKSFLLTFDDGPTAVGGDTDKVIAMLNREKLSGIFFISGDKLKSRLAAVGKEKISNLYGDHWVGSHSMVHQSHQYLKDWKLQVDECYQLIKSNFNLNNQTVYFRPPYGQRTLEMTQYLLKNNQPTLLWNIDSQDWSNKISAQQVSSRVITLMLLWRKGIILFHDVHSKAVVAVPEIKDYFKNANIKWLQPNRIQ